MDRRTYLRDLAALGSVGATAGLAGCSGVLGGDGGNPNVTLGPPDTQGDPGDFAYPGYGQRVPDVTLSDPIADVEIDVRDVGTPYVTTFVFTHCLDVCPLLTQALERVQADAAENGYGDAVTFLDLTFDPARDDAERFEAYAEERDVDLEAGNWHFLRAGGPERTRAVVADDHPDGFGVPYRREDRTTAGGGTTATPESTATPGATTGGDGGTATGEDGHGHEGYGFSHLSLVLLANAEGYVERAYPGPNPPVERIVDDLSRVR